jgi:hypothetical protein
MLVAIVFVALVLSAGYATLRVLGLAKGVAAVGIAPAAGLAAFTLVTTWAGSFGLPAPVAGLLVLVCSLSGAIWLVADREGLGTAVGALWREHRGAVVVLLAAVLGQVVTMAVAFAGVQAPLSPHDGAFHVETSDTFRQGAAVLQWYPPGVAALFGGTLQLLPGLDTAAGATQLGMALTLLAPITVFGLGAVVLRNLLAASAGALFVSLTHLFPYYPQIWSGWPQLLGILLVIGIWIVALEYLRRPSWRWAVLAGLLLGAIIVVHGTELYTSLLVLAVLAIANWRTIDWRRLPLDVLGAVALGLVCAAPYLPALLHWAGAGGAYQVGYEDGSTLEQGTSSAAQLLGLFSLDALGVDFPIRVLLVLVGLVWTLKAGVGRTVAAVAGVFIGLALLFTFGNGIPPVRAVFSATYPWSLPYRHLTFAVVPLALLAGAGWVVAANQWDGIVGRVRSVAGRRRAGRVGRIVVIAWLLLAAWGLETLLSIERGGDSSFSADDAAAMAWMRQNVAPGTLVVNDTFADAGIWAPYKAGVPILVYRSVYDPATAGQRRLVLQDVANLDQNPAAAAAACALNARYVYYGAANAAWQERSFPPLEDLEASPALRLVFRQGNAAVFETVLNC